MNQAAYRHLQPKLDLEPYPESVVIIRNSIFHSIIRQIQLHLQTVTYNITRQTYSTLIPNLVPCKILNAAIRQNRGIPDRYLPLLVEQITGLEIRALTGKYKRIRRIYIRRI